MKLQIVFAFVLFSARLGAQSELYNLHIAQAEELYKKADYAGASAKYSDAFRSNGWKGYGPDRYNAAKAWSLAGVPDSALFNLFRLAEKMGYDKYNELNEEQAFNAMHALPRWKELCALVKSNQPSMPELAKELEAIHTSDQEHRQKIGEIEKKYGGNSPEMEQQWQLIDKADAANVARVTQILDTHGWLGAKAVGTQGNSALFLVIQHADLKTQEKYLPMMREAVKNGNAKGSSLALLEDRILMRNGKKQIYGSQVRKDKATGKSYFFPIEDVDHVDERRAAVGLEPLAIYGEYFGIYWGPEAIENNKKMAPDPAETPK